MVIVPLRFTWVEVLLLELVPPHPAMTTAAAATIATPTDWPQRCQAFTCLPPLGPPADAVRMAWSSGRAEPVQRESSPGSRSCQGRFRRQFKVGRYLCRSSDPAREAPRHRPRVLSTPGPRILIPSDDGQGPSRRIDPPG